MKNSSNVTVILPTKNGQDRAQYILDNILAWNCPITVVVNKDRPEDAPLNLCGASVIYCPPNAGSVKALELGIIYAETPYVVILNDDLEFTSRSNGWLDEICRVYAENFGDGSAVVASNDDTFQGRIACFPLMARKFYLDHCYPAPYRSWLVDNEWTDKAKALGVYAYAENAFFKHLNIHGHDEAVFASDTALHAARMNDFYANLRRT